MGTFLSSYFEQQGLKVIISTARNADVFNVASRIISYSHEKSANGGCISAQVEISVAWNEIDNWLYNGVGSWVTVYSASGSRIWNGKINRVTIRFSGNTIEIGDLMNLANRVSVAYSPINYATTPATVGTATETTLAENSASQSKYGIIERVINAGQCTHAEAQTIRNLYLKENSYPQVSSNISLTGTASSEDVKITLDCIGNTLYAFKTWIYNNFTNGAQSLSDKVKAIFSAESLINNVQRGGSLAGAGVNLYGVETNSYLVSAQETKNRYAWDILLSCANVGDGSDNRWIVGLTPDNLGYYRTIGTTITYEYYLSQERQEICTFYHRVPILPYDVNPGYWMRIMDLSTSRMPLSDIYAEPRDVFIESVRYTAPWTLDITASRQHKVSQLLAKFTGGAGLS